MADLSSGEEAAHKPLLSPAPGEQGPVQSQPRLSQEQERVRRAGDVVLNIDEELLRPNGDPSAVLLQSDLFAWSGKGVPSAAGKGPQSRAQTVLTCSAVTLSIAGRVAHVLPLEDLVGAEQASPSSLRLHCYPRKRGCCGCGGEPQGPAEREHVEVTLAAARPEVEAGAAQAVQSWLRTLRSVLALPWLQSSALDLSAGDVPRDRRILFLINPASGAGNAAANLAKLLPLIKHSGVPYDVLRTTHANHAFEVAQGLDARAPGSPTDLVCVSGDGLVHEVLNGLMQREDWAAATRQFRLGHIGGGSGNGLASAICANSQEPISIHASAFLLAKGYSRPFDSFAVSQPGEAALRFGCLSMSYGLISDVDAGSEHMRYLGNARFTVSALKAMVDMKRYDVRVQVIDEHAHNHEGEEKEEDQPYQAADAASAKGAPAQQRPRPQRCSLVENGCDACGHVGEGRAARHEDGRRELQRYLDQRRANAAGAVPAAAAAASAAGDVAAAASALPSALPAAGAAAERWVDVSDSFVLLWLLNTTHAASDMFVAPTAHYSDGCMELYSIRTIPRMQMLKLFLSMENGTHMDSAPAVAGHIQCRRVRALRVEPLDPAVAQGSNKAVSGSQLMVDGEKVPYKPMEVRVFRGIINLLAK